MRPSVILACFLAGAAFPVFASAKGEQAAAEAVLIKLVQGRPGEAAALLHYPPSYSLAEREEDAAGVTQFLVTHLEAFGSPTEPELHREPVTTVDSGVSGGSVPYWAKLSPFDSAQFLYRVTFSKAGAGFLKFVVFHHPDSDNPEVQSIWFAFAPENLPGLTTQQSEGPSS